MHYYLLRFGMNRACPMESGERFEYNVRTIDMIRV